MEDTKETRLSKHSGTNTYTNSQRLAACTQPAQVCIGEGPSTERRSGRKMPSLDPKLCLIDKYSQMKNRVSPTSVITLQQDNPLFRAASCPTGDSQHKINIMVSLENVSQVLTRILFNLIGPLCIYYSSPVLCF